MAYNDDDLNQIFPTRQGQAIGSSDERKMMDAIKDVSGFRTRIQNNADGSITRLRTRGGNPEFVTDPALATPGKEDVPDFVEMDSGSIDMVAVAPLNEHRFDDGILHYGDVTRMYYGVSTLLGKIVPPKLTSKTPPPELSSPKSYQVLPNYAGVRNADMLDLLYIKKACTGFVPASMFCGRARLYAQAQYGAPLKYWKWAPNIGTGSPPELQYAGAGGWSRALTTHSGVYLDSQKTHWLLSMDNLGVKITRLKRDLSVEKLVPLIGTEPDTDKIEAYILSRSYPDPEMDFWIAIPNTPVCDMFGYGWKFNWDGDKADIIHIDTHEISLNVFEFTSIHYRVAFTRAWSITVDPALSAVDQEKLRWSAMLSVVEASAPWRNFKFNEVIASPVWEEQQLGIFGTVLGGAYGDAPVYCFYKRNEAQVFRYSATGGDSEVKYRRTGDVGWMGNHDWSVEPTTLTQYHGTVGLEGASGEYQMRNHKPFTSGFSGPGVSAVMTTQSYSFVYQDCEGKSVSNVTYHSSGSAGINSAYYGDAVMAPSFIRNLSDGVPFYEGRPVGPTLGSTAYGILEASIGAGGGCDITATQNESVGTHSEADNIAMIIPFGDAESAYFSAVKSTTRDEDKKSMTATSNSGSQFLIYYKWNNGTDSENWMASFGAGGDKLPSGTWSGTTNYRTTTYDTVASVLATSTGIVPYTPPDSMAPFFAGEDTVSKTYWTNSSVMGTVFGQGATRANGYTDPNDYRFIGWA